MVTILFGSENKKLAQTGFQFLSISADARGGGMGDAMTTIFGNSSSLFFNPAGMSRQKQLIDFKKGYNVQYPLLWGAQNILQNILLQYGGVYSVPMSFLINRKGEIIRVYPGAILKQYDQNMYTDLIFNIEKSLQEKTLD